MSTPASHLHRGALCTIAGALLLTTSSTTALRAAEHTLMPTPADRPYRLLPRHPEAGAEHRFRRHRHARKRGDDRAGRDRPIRRGAAQRRAAISARHLRHREGPRPRPAHSHRTDRDQGRDAGRRARSAHPRRHAAARLGLQPPAALYRRAAGRVHRAVDPHHPDRPPEEDRRGRQGRGRSGRQAVLRHDGRRAGRFARPHQQRPARRPHRQHRQQGPERRHHAVTCRCTWRARCSRPATPMPRRATARST